jgi:hypothetical protein
MAQRGAGGSNGKRRAGAWWLAKQANLEKGEMA